jgi:serine/threonine protein kinase
MPVKSDSGSGQKIKDSTPVLSDISPTLPDVRPDIGQVPLENNHFGWKATVSQYVGQTVDKKYELLELVGTGGMGSVYKAMQLSTQRIVAVKMLLPHLANEGPSLRRFQLEAKAASRIDHPNSITVYDFGVWQDQAYLVMEFVEGSSLSQVIREKGKLNLIESLPIFRQACAGLGAAHRLGIYHRDVKPSNFMVIPTEDGIVVKVCDFGLVKLKVTEGDTITGTGEVFGSPPYMSPEQCLGRKIDERSDIYGLGCLIYETLTGFVPIKGANPLDTMRKQVQAPPQPLALSDVDPAIALKAKVFIEKTLAKEPGDRFQTMQQLGEALDELHAELQLRSGPPENSINHWGQRMIPGWDAFQKKRKSPFEK